MIIKARGLNTTYWEGFEDSTSWIAINNKTLKDGLWEKRCEKCQQEINEDVEPYQIIYIKPRPSFFHSKCRPDLKKEFEIMKIMYKLEQ